MTAVALCVLGAALAAGGCASREPRVPRVTTITIDSVTRAPPRAVEPPRAASFWAAIADLDLRQLEDLAMGPEERRFRDALALLLHGETAAAEARFDTLYATATDLFVRYRSRIALTGLLYAQEKWQRLVELPRDTTAYDAEAVPDRATLESWAVLFRRLPPEVVTFETPVSVVQLSRTPLGTPLVSAQVNGQTRLLWLDTGSSFTMLSSELAAAAGIAPVASDTLEVVTMTGRVTAHAAMIDSLRVGGVRFVHHPAMIVDASRLRLTMPGPPGEAQVLAIDGIIGFDAIRRLDLEIDYGRERVTLRRPARRATGERNLFWLGYPLVRLRASTGRFVHLGLDTGADETFATRSLLAKVRAPRLVKDERRLEGIGGASTIEVQMIPELRLTLGTHTVRFTNLIVVPSRRTTFVNLDGVLGTNAWHAARLRIDMLNGRVDIEPSP